jgi:hypothetical protein
MKDMQWDSMRNPIFLCCNISGLKISEQQVYSCEFEKDEPEAEN